MDHAFIIDLSGHEEATGKMVLLGGNAPTHLVLTSPYYTAGVTIKAYQGQEPTPEEIAAAEAKRLAKEAALEEARHARAMATRERKAEEKRLRAEMAERNRAEYKARKAAEKPKKESPILDTRPQKRVKRVFKEKVYNPVPSGYVGLEEAALIVGVCVNTVYKYVEQGTLSCHRIGRRKYVRPGDLRADFESRQKLLTEWKRSFGQRRKEAAKK